MSGGAVQRRIAALETTTTTTTTSSSMINPMKSSSKANATAAITTPPRRRNNHHEIFGALTTEPTKSVTHVRRNAVADRSSSLERLVVASPATTASSTQPGSSSVSHEASLHRRSRLQAMAGASSSPPSATSAPLASFRTTTITTTTTTTAQPKQPKTAVLLGNMVAERMKERRGGVSPQPSQSATQPSPAASTTSAVTRTTNKKRLGELVAQRMQMKQASPVASLTRPINTNAEPILEQQQQQQCSYTRQRPVPLSPPCNTTATSNNDSPSNAVSPTNFNPAPPPSTSTSPLHSRPYRPMNHHRSPKGSSPTSSTSPTTPTAFRSPATTNTSRRSPRSIPTLRTPTSPQNGCSLKTSKDLKTPMIQTAVSPKSAPNTPTRTHFPNNYRTTFPTSSSSSPRTPSTNHNNDMSLGSIAQERIRERRRNLGSRVALRMQERRALEMAAGVRKSNSPKSHAVAARLRSRRRHPHASHDNTNTTTTPTSRLVRQAMERAKEKHKEQQNYHKQHSNSSAAAAAAAAFDPFGGSASDTTDAEALMFSEDSLLLQQPDLQHDMTDDDMTLTSVRQIVETARNVSNALPRNSSHSIGNAGGGPAAAVTFRVKDDDTYYDDEEDDDEEEDDEEEEVVEDDGEDAEDEDSQGSVSYAERQRRKEKEVRRRAAAAAAAKVEGPFIVQDDVEHYRRAVDTPLSRTVVGVAVAATTGCLVLGPVGLLVGAAAVGIIVGYMQIPEVERNNMNKKASEALHNFQNSALSASDSLSHQCATTYQSSGVADHVPLELQNCCSSFAADMEQVAHFRDTNYDVSAKDSTDDNIDEAALDAAAPRTPPPTRKTTKRTKVACLRTVNVVPISHIYALDPSRQPKAWLDILASADTRLEDKIEATEEITILAKDKQKCRIFVNEGILDCLLWTIGRYLEKKRGGPGSEYWAHPDISPLEATAAKVTSLCCLTLGKSYCAAIHTEGDLQLMSLYERGSVPEERQLAQMLLEVPHHARATRKEDPTIIANETFVLKQLNLAQAEELAASISAIASGDL